MVSILAIVIGMGACVANGITLGQDIGAPLNRAQVAANPADVDKYMAEVQSGMEKHGMTNGNWVWFGINKNVDNDFGVAYDAVKSIRERLQNMKGFDPKSTEYQVALNDVRGTIRELNIGQQSRNGWEHAWVLIFVVTAILGGGMIVVADS